MLSLLWPRQGRIGQNQSVSRVPRSGYDRRRARLNTHAQRGDSVCTNGLMVRRLELDRQLLAGLQERVLHSDVVEYTVKRFEKELAKALAAPQQENADLRRKPMKSNAA